MLDSFLSYPLVGISFSRQTVLAVRLRRRWQSCIYEDHVQYGGENLLDPGGDYGNLAASLRNAVRHLAGSGGILRVALPGPLVQTTLLRVEERPKNRSEAEAMIAWHVARQTGAGISCRVAAHLFAGGNGDHHLYGIAVDNALYRCLEETLRAERLGLEVVDAAATCRWNSLPASVRGRPGVLVDILDGYWTLMVWEEARYPLLVKSGWLTALDSAAETDRMAREVFRLLASAGREGGSGQAGGFYLLAPPEDAGIAGDSLRDTVGVSFRVLAVGADTGGARVRGLPAAMAGCPAVEIACVR